MPTGVRAGGAYTTQGTACSARLSRSDAVFRFTTHDPLRKRVANPGVYGLGSALRSVGAGGGGDAAGHADLTPSGAFIDPSYPEALEYLAMPHFHERRYDLKSCSSSSRASPAPSCAPARWRRSAPSGCGNSTAARAPSWRTWATPNTTPPAMR